MFARVKSEKGLLHKALFFDHEYQLIGHSPIGSTPFQQFNPTFYREQIFVAAKP